MNRHAGSSRAYRQTAPPLAILAAFVSLSIFLGALFTGEGVATAATPPARQTPVVTASSAVAYPDIQVDGLGVTTFERAAAYVHMVRGRLVVAPTVVEAIGRTGATRLDSLVAQVNREAGVDATATAGYGSTNGRLPSALAPDGWWQDLVCAGAIVSSLAALAGLIFFVTWLTGTWDLWYAVSLILGAGTWNEKVRFLISLGVTFGTATGIASAC